MQRIQQIVLQKSFYTVYAELSTYIIIMWISVVDSHVAHTLNITRDQNDVLSLKAVRLDVITNLKRFWGQGHQRPNFGGRIYIHYSVPLYFSRLLTKVHKILG